MKGGLGGNRVVITAIWDYFSETFLSVFLVHLQITFLCILGVIWGALGSLLESILGVPRNSENSSPSCTKTIVLQIWRGPVWYLLALFFEGRFLASLFYVFY